jgi:hypothetical protein
VLFDTVAVLHGFQLWRLITCFFVWPLGFSFLIEMFFLLRHSQQLEQVEFLGRTADYVWMLVLCAPALWLGAWLLRLFILGQSLVMTILYFWSRKYPDETMTFMFGFRFKSLYLPWVLVGFHFLTGGSPAPELLGIAVGHMYWFALDVLPRTHGIRLIKTPALIQRWLPNAGVAGIRGVGGAFYPRPRFPEPGRVPPPGGHQWGAGHVLGD